MEQTCLFGPNFLEKYAGKSILRDPKIAIVELVANSWDAGAKSVKIIWPSRENEQFFSIEDDGEGLTEQEFSSRWRTLSYNRLEAQGETVIIDGRKRTVFGQNGIGRLAGFCFGDSYFVNSTKGDSTIEYEVRLGSNAAAPFTLIKHNVSEPKKVPGTRIFVKSESYINVSEESIRSELGMRFLTDPLFSCYVNGVRVSFSDIPKENIANETITLESGDMIKITIIDTIESDKTTKQHGIAWHVNGRLVGEANWKEYGFDEIVDGRSAEAKRHTIIVSVDFLKPSVKHDWTGFKKTTEFTLARDKVYDFVKAHILGQTKQKRAKTLELVKKAHQQELNELTPLRVERWVDFMEQVQEECASIKEKDLTKLAGLLVKMEQSDSKYSLIAKLHELNSDQIDNLHTILTEWSLDLAKEVLDELQLRLKLLDELRMRVFDTNTREVQDLQPLFYQGLWIFGPEYETIEFTSNEGMSKVIHKLFNSKESGSRNRPDFAILPDSTVGSYSYPAYDSDGGEIGVDRLVIVELKKPGVPISTDEKDQCWKYVRELRQKGLITADTRVTCFVIGSEVDPIEREARLENNGRYVIQPMDYQTVIVRAKSRLLKLYERVKGAPFLEEQRQNMDQEPIQDDLISAKLVAM